MIARQLGSDGPHVSAIGLGCMGMSDFYGLTLTPDDLAQIERAIPAGAAAGDRYDAAQMRELDSERGREQNR